MKNHTTLAVAAMMVMMAAPATMADPGAYDDKKSVSGPGSFHIQGTHAQGPGTVHFDVNHLTGAAEGVRFWVEWTGGFFSPVQGGFFILPCADRDDDGGCFSTDAWDDDHTISFAPPVPCPTNDQCNLNQEPYDDIFGPYGYSNDALVQRAPCDKDIKDCGDPIAAESTFCITPDTTYKDMFKNPNPQRTPGGVYDDVTLFIGAWEGSFSESGKVGAGLSSGTYDIYIEFMGAGCTVSPR